MKGHDTVSKMRRINAVPPSGARLAGSLIQLVLKEQRTSGIRRSIHPLGVRHINVALLMVS